MKIMVKMKNRAHRCDINRPRPRHRHKYTTFEAQIMKMLNNTDAEFKKSLAYKKACS